MSDERKPSVKLSTQRVLGWVIVLLGILWIALPFWFYARMSKMTPLDAFVFAPVLLIGLHVIWLGAVLILTVKRSN